MTEQRNRILLFGIVTGMFWFSLYAYSPILAPYAASLGASHRLIGLILGSYGFTQMLLRIPLGMLSDKFGNRRLFIILGLASSLLSSLGLWYFPHPGLLLLFRALAGVTASTWVAFTVLYASYFQGEDTTRAIGYINTFCFGGQIVALLVAGFAAQHFGQTAPFFVAAIGSLIGILLSFGIVEKRPARNAPVKADDLFEVIRGRNLYAVSLLAVFSQVISYSSAYGFTPVVAKNIGADSFELFKLTILTTLPVMIASPLSGALLSKKIGEAKIIFSGFLLSSFACFVIPYISSLNLLYITQFAGGFGRGMLFPLLMSLSIKTVSFEKRATTMGFFQAVYALGIFLGPVMVGVLSESVGIVWGFWTAGGLGIFSALAALLCIGNKMGVGR